MNVIWDFIIKCYNWTRQNDTPNLIIFLFTFIIWPTILFFISRKTIRKIPNLLVSVFKVNITMGCKQYEAIEFHFKNRTGQVVYLTNARIIKCSKKFSVHPDASRDIITQSHELKFKDDSGNSFNKDQVTINTGKEAITCIAIINIDEKFFNYKPCWARKMLGLRNFFRLKYDAMVGNKHYKVSTAY